MEEPLRTEHTSFPSKRDQPTYQQMLRFTQSVSVVNVETLFKHIQLLNTILHQTDWRLKQEIMSILLGQVPTRTQKNNAGQGTAGQDRNNIILLEDASYKYAQDRTSDKPNKYGHWANSYPKTISGASTFLGLTTNDAKNLANALNKREFALGLRKVDKVGMFRFYSTRNNAFTNRGQKACVKVNPSTKKDATSSMMSDEDRINAELQDVEASLQEVINEFQS